MLAGLIVGGLLVLSALAAIVMGEFVLPGGVGTYVYGTHARVASFCLALLGLSLMRPFISQTMGESQARGVADIVAFCAGALAVVIMSSGVDPSRLRIFAIMLVTIVVVLTVHAIGSFFSTMRNEISRQRSQ